MNLSSRLRLSDYFQNSYLNYQASRGSAISAAIIKHGLSQFTLQIIELGPSPSRYIISVKSDFILLEQYYLDRYKLIYNIRRLALGPAPVLSSEYKNLPMGEKNIQYGKEGVNSAAWDHKHSEDQKRLWSLTRSTPIFIYNFDSLTFNSIVCGYERLADFLGVHTNTARRAVKSNIFSKQYILLLSELNNENILTIKESIKPKNTAIKKVYVYNKDYSILLKTYSSLNAFMKISKLIGSDVKILCTTDKLWLDEYYLSYELIDDADNT
jgi:group I intron endonuclease